jgi:hypothetical protein
MPGKRFSLLTVESLTPGGKYLCRCDCGGLGRYDKAALEGGRVKSCGCFNKTKARKPGVFTAWAQWLRYQQWQAESRDIPFQLTSDQVKLICSSDCHYCGEPPAPWEGARRNYLASCKQKGHLPDLALADSKIILLNGIDRLDSGGVYEAGNVVPCCETCNKAKLSMSLEQFVRWIRKVNQHTKTWKIAET